MCILLYQFSTTWCDPIPETRNRQQTEEVGRKKHRLIQPSTPLVIWVSFWKNVIKNDKNIFSIRKSLPSIAGLCVWLCSASLFNIFVKIFIFIYCLHRTKQLIHSFIDRKRITTFTTMWIKGRSHIVLLFFMNRASKMWCFCFAGKNY